MATSTRCELSWLVVLSIVLNVALFLDAGWTSHHLCIASESRCHFSASFLMHYPNFSTFSHIHASVKNLKLLNISLRLAVDLSQANSQLSGDIEMNPGPHDGMNPTNIRRKAAKNPLLEDYSR